MRMKWLMYVACAVVASAAYARSTAIDFRTDKTGAGWDLGDTQYDTSRGRKFPSDDAVLTSPCFDGNITSVTVVVSFTQSVSNAPAINVWAGSDTNSATLCDSITNRTTNVSTTNVLTFAAADAIHALKFTSNRKGNTRVNPFVVSVTVRWVGGALSAPVNLVAASTSANAFHASWDTVEDAEEYTFRVWQNVLRPPSCDYVWNETFEGMTHKGLERTGGMFSKRHGRIVRAADHERVEERIDGPRDGMRRSHPSRDGIESRHASLATPAGRQRPQVGCGGVVPQPCNGHDAGETRPGRRDERP